jgi:predicted DNA-binding transcriptional regulator YafY
MRRADRLFRLIQKLRRRRGAVTARQLADELEVSERTVYRDVADLVDSGVPIRGEAGVGYLLARSYDLPPLNFDEQELEALALGARIVRGWADPALAAAAEDALAKVEAALPPNLRGELAGTALFALNLREPGTTRETLGTLRRAVREKRKTRFAYTDNEQAQSRRTVQPLGLFYWGAVWTLGAWCELRVGFRSFRLDRIGELEVLTERFQDEPGRTLADLFAHYKEES